MFLNQIFVIIKIFYYLSLYSIYLILKSLFPFLLFIIIKLYYLLNILILHFLIITIIKMIKHLFPIIISHTSLIIKPFHFILIPIILIKDSINP